MNLKTTILLLLSFLVFVDVNAQTQPPPQWNGPNNTTDVIHRTGNIRVNNYDVPGGNGYGLRFWTDDNYKIHMGNLAEYKYGSVTDYSMKFNMNPQSNRGWTWGIAGQTPIAALNTQGKFQIENDFTAIGNIFANSHIYGRSVPDQYSNLYRFGGLYFTWTNLYGTRTEHSIRSTYGSTYGDNLTINSFNHLRINIDANNNNPESFFEVGHDTENTENVLMRLVSPTGNLGVGLGNTNPETKLEVNGHLTLNALGNANIYVGRGTQNFGRYLYILNSKQNEAAAGLKAGRLVVSDTYAYADPEPNDLIVKGRIGIGTISPGDFRLAVAGKIKAQQVIVSMDGWPDYVFESSYSLPTLEEVERHIKEKGHLKDIPSAKDVEEDGVSLGEMDKKLLQKIEELTLYMIEQGKQIEDLKKEIQVLQNK